MSGTCCRHAVCFRAGKAIEAVTETRKPEVFGELLQLNYTVKRHFRRKGPLLPPGLFLFRRCLDEPPEIDFQTFGNAQKNIESGLSQFTFDEGDHADVEPGTLRQHIHGEIFAQPLVSQPVDEVR